MDMANLFKHFFREFFFFFVLFNFPRLLSLLVCLSLQVVFESFCLNFERFLFLCAGAVVRLFSSSFIITLSDFSLWLFGLQVSQMNVSYLEQAVESDFCANMLCWQREGVS